MATKRVEAIFKLRRDNDYNYEKVKDTFIPVKGEVCLVDTARLGLCVKVGDGVSTYGSLEYVNTIFQMVTFVEGKAFVNDKEITPSGNKIYIDANNTNDLYYYNGVEFVLIGPGSLPTASAETAGIMKLYSTTGENVDGTMTQKAITDELNTKVSASVNLEDETVVFK
nr:MAG TPA: hyaluronidase [Caudoviricetes sp.]